MKLPNGTDIGAQCQNQNWDPEVVFSPSDISDSLKLLVQEPYLLFLLILAVEQEEFESLLVTKIRSRAPADLTLIMSGLKRNHIATW